MSFQFLNVDSWKLQAIKFNVEIPRNIVVLLSIK